MSPSDRFVENLPDDPELEARLRLAAASSPTPALPPETEALPWTVQRAPRAGRLERWFHLSLGATSIARSLAGLVRLSAALAASLALLFFLTQVRAAGDGADYVIPPGATPAPSAPAAPGAPRVVVIAATGTVDDIMADYVGGQIRRAEADGAAAAIVRLDTLGGSLTAMDRISGALEAKIPTIVWVGPSGARAMSAGTFITMAADLAYMAPSTTIGAASPVASGGGDIATVFGQTEAEKIRQTADATIRSYAQRHHPQAVSWASTTVVDAKAYSAQEALSAQAINGIAGSVQDVLAQANGQKVMIGTQQVTVDVAGATITEVREDAIQAVLHTLDDPNIAFILLVIGVLCVLVEFFHPTLLVGLAGALALALSFYGSGSLPLNVLGVILVVLGIVMLVLEPSVPSHGLLSIGGLACFVIGAVAFYGSPGPYLPAVSVAWPIIATMAVVAGAFALIFVRTALQMRHVALAEGTGMVGSVTPIGQVGEVRGELTPVGTVYVAGEYWSARSADGAIRAGAKVRVLGQDGLTLVVTPADEPQ